MVAFTARRVAGAVGQFAPDGGRMREASRLVTGLLQHGGTAAVLHKAAGTVKPLEGLPLGCRPLALRQFVPVTADEYSGFRTLDFEGRRAGASAPAGTWPAIAARWAQG